MLSLKLKNGKEISVEKVMPKTLLIEFEGDCIYTGSDIKTVHNDILTQIVKLSSDINKEDEEEIDSFLDKAKKLI